MGNLVTDWKCPIIGPSTEQHAMITVLTLAHYCLEDKKIHDSHNLGPHFLGMIERTVSQNMQSELCI